MTPVAIVTDEDLRQWRLCARRWWRHLHLPSQVSAAPPVAAADPEAIQGPAPELALRSSHPGALSIVPPATPADWPRALQDTRDALDDERLQQPGGTVLGACLMSDDGVFVRIDVLERVSHGWKLLKLRLATAGDEADVDIVALWTHVAARCGLRVAASGLLLMDTEFVYPGHGWYAGLFREADVGPVLGTRPVPQWLVAMRREARGAQPAGAPGAHCQRPRPCEALGLCRHEACGTAAAGHEQPDWPLGLPAADSLELLGRERAAVLRARGHHSLRDVPAEALADEPRLQRVRQAVHEGREVLDGAVGPLLRALGWPRHTLRLETIGFAIPVWPGTRPYQVLPLQFGIDVQAAPDAPVEHRAFIAGPGGDPRRALTEALLAALGRSGPVFAYNAGFERNRLRELATLWPDLAPALDALQPRIVDLFQLARAHWYHPAQRGSWSFRAVAEALAPQLQAHVETCDGLPSAQAAHARCLQPQTDAASREHLRHALQQRLRAQCALLRAMLARFEHGVTAAPAPH